MNGIVGDWVGIARHADGAWLIKFRISESNDLLKAVAYTYGEPAEHGVAEFHGTLDEDESSGTLWIVDYALDNPAGNRTFAGLLALVYEAGDRLRATYHNDIAGNDFSFFLQRPPKRFWPCRFSKLYRLWLHFKLWLLRRVRFFYVAFLLLIVISSVWRVKGAHLDAWAALVLIIPLVILFRNHALNFIQTLRLKKVGPVEFHEQPQLTRQNVARPPEQVQKELLSKFGEETLSRFVALSRFFVPRTKWLLERIHRRNSAQTRRALEELAVLVGIPMNNFEATLATLVDVNMLAITEEGKYEVTNLAQQYLVYEETVRNFSS